MIFISLSLGGVVGRHVGLIDVETTWHQLPQVFSHGMGACMDTNQDCVSNKKHSFHPLDIPADIALADRLGDLRENSS